MAQQIRDVFAVSKANKRPAFIAYVTGGYPSKSEFISILLGLQSGGADIIEIGIPFSDPIADGPTIQNSSFIALKAGIDIKTCLALVKRAREEGLYTPIVVMGYYNPFLIFGEEKLMAECVDAGVNGFIVVDLPPEEAVEFRNLAHKYCLSYIPLITPTTSIERIKKLVGIASSFIYVVSVSGVTGARLKVSDSLPSLIEKIKEFTTCPLAVGFGVSTRQQFIDVSLHADGVVIGSKIIEILTNSTEGKCGADAMIFASSITTRSDCVFEKNTLPDIIPTSSADIIPTLEINPIIHSDTTPGIPSNTSTIADESRFGQFGGQYAPEALVDCLDEIESAFKEACADPEFWKEFRSYYPYMNRPSQLHLADRLTKHCNGAKIWLKREDLNHTGAHKINNALGQALLAKRLGKKRIIAETGAGQHGVATATICAKLGLECIIYMGSEDVRRQALNVFRIKLLGATVIPVSSGSKTLKDAINEAMRDWVSNVSTTHYIIGSAIGPHPFPTMVREFQSVIGRETRVQMLEIAGKLPDYVIACVGGGSNAIGIFHPFIADKTVKLIGVEAGGDGIDTPRHSATISKGTPGVLHGTKTLLIQDGNGQILETHSVSAGLDYPGVGPEHAWLKESGRAEYVVATDVDSFIGFRLLCETEGIIPALETSHAIYYAAEIAKTMSAETDIVICVSGRGDKDVMTVAESLPSIGPLIGWDLRFDE